jgi:Flp pilus assembly protein TadG
MNSQQILPVNQARRRRQKGQSLIESALLSIIFFSLLIGAFDFGQFLFIHQALVERARSAARWGMIDGATNLDSIRNMVLYNQSSTPSSGTTGYFNLTSSMVTVTSTDANTDDWLLTIKIDNYPYSILSPYISGTYYGPGIVVAVPLGRYN